jgi:ABC-type uncharacterized transport system ATPase component
LRFEDIAGRSQILSGPNEVYALVNREKDDSGRATRTSQLLRDMEATDITQIDIEENNVWLEVRGLVNRQRTGRERPNNQELPLEEIHQDLEHFRAIIDTQESFHSSLSFFV